MLSSTRQAIYCAEKMNSKVSRTIKRIVKEESNWSLLKVGTAALTAITMSLISSKLIGVINSLLLVGIISVMTATVSELFRIIFEVTHVGVKTVVARSITTKPDDDTQDEEEPAISTEPESLNKQISARFVKIVRVIAFLCAVSLLTLGISYAVAKYTRGEVEVIEHHQTIEKTERLSKSELEEIERDVTATLSSQYRDVDSKRLDALENEVRDRDAALKTLQEALDAANEKLQNVDDIRKRLEVLEAKESAHNTTKTPEPTATPPPETDDNNEKPIP